MKDQQMRLKCASQFQGNTFKRNLQIKLGAVKRCRKEYTHYYNQLAAHGLSLTPENGQQSHDKAECPFSNVQSQESISVCMDAKARLQDFAKQLVDLLSEYEPQAQEETLNEKERQLIEDIESLYKEAQGEITILKQEHPEVQIC